MKDHTTISKESKERRLEGGSGWTPASNPDSLSEAEYPTPYHWRTTSEPHSVASASLCAHSERPNMPKGHWLSDSSRPEDSSDYGNVPVSGHGYYSAWSDSYPTGYKEGSDSHESSSMSPPHSAPFGSSKSQLGLLATLIALLVTCLVQGSAMLLTHEGQLEHVQSQNKVISANTLKILERIRQLEVSLAALTIELENIKEGGWLSPPPLAPSKSSRHQESGSSKSHSAK